MDAVELIRKLRVRLPKNTLIYLDPPYYNKGKELYMNYYRDVDHQNIAKEIIKNKKQKWIITYDDANLIRKLYDNSKKRRYPLPYSAGKQKQGNELMIFSDNLKILRLPSVK